MSSESGIQGTSHRFLVTYGSSGATITHSMWAEHSKLIVDENYTLTQRDLKYTLMHTKQRTYRSTVSSFMNKMSDILGIKKTNVFGYETVSMSSEIDDHPGMKLIIESVNSGSPSLDCWTADGDVRKNRRGLLYHHLVGISEESMSKSMLVKHARDLKKKNEEMSAKLAATESENEQVRDENKRLKTKVETLEFVFITSGREHLLRPPAQ